MENETKNPFPKEWQLWKIVVPNEHKDDPEDPKRRPVILTETWVDEGEDDENLDEYYPSFAVGTTQVERYQYEPDTFVFDAPEQLEAYKLSKPTIFRFGKSEGKFTEDLTLKDFIEKGEYVADITPEDKALIKRSLNNKVGHSTILHDGLLKESAVTDDSIDYLRDWLQLGKEPHMKGFDADAKKAFIVFPTGVDVDDLRSKSGIGTWLDEHGFDWKAEKTDYTYKTVGSFNTRTMSKSGAGRDRTLKDRVRLDISWGDVDLNEDIEVHDELNPKLFDGDELKPEVKDAVRNIADAFMEGLAEDGIKFNLKDIVLIGSNVNYNYNKDSDLDIHLIADSSGLECPDELYPLLYSAYRSIFNKNYEITIKGIPAEIYVEMDEPQGRSNGVYSLNDGWVRKPERREIPDIDMEAFEKLFSEWEDRYFEVKNEAEEELASREHPLDESLIVEGTTSADVYDFVEDVYELRKESIAKDGEFGLGNLVFKQMRALGYLDELKELIRQLKSKELSLENLSESAEEKSDVEKLFWNIRDEDDKVAVAILDKHNGKNIMYDARKDKIVPVPKSKTKNRFAVTREQLRDGVLASEEEMRSFMKEVGGDEIVFYADRDNLWGGEYSVITKDEEKARKACAKYNQDGYAVFDSKGDYEMSRDRNGERIREKPVDKDSEPA